MKTRHDYFGEKFTKAAMETSIRKIERTRARDREREKWRRVRGREQIHSGLILSVSFHLDAMQLRDSVAQWSVTVEQHKSRNCNVRPISFQCVAPAIGGCYLLLLFDFNWPSVYSIYQLSNGTVIQFDSISLTIEWRRPTTFGFKNWSHNESAAGQ